MPLFGQKTSRASRAAEIAGEASLKGWLLRTLRDRGVQLRLLLCLAAIAAVLVVVKGWRAPQQWRIGDRPAQGILRLAADTDKPTETVEQWIVKRGQTVDIISLNQIWEQYEALPAPPTTLQLARATGVLALLLLLAILNGAYLVRYRPRLVGHAGRLVSYLASLVIAVLLARLLSLDPWRAEMIPVLATVMVITIAWDHVVAILTAVTLSLIISLSTVGQLDHVIVLLSVSASAILPLSEISSRSTVIKVGFRAGLVFVAVRLGMAVVSDGVVLSDLSETTWLWHTLRGFLWCLVAGYLVAGSLPFIESVFGLVTDISLLELGDASHPLLQEMVQRAPGTYNHSIVVGTIGEAAADVIGANGLLVRVGAYFHDIGKMLKPEYFIENMTEGMRSRHQQLAPAMSTLIIIGHVKDGVELGRQYNLPQPLIDFIEQHHGTTLVEYFFHEAEKQAQTDESSESQNGVEESSFRYPGPRPRTRESGVLMLADAVESASRALSEPTPKRIEGLVHKITLDRLLDGQFEECELKLREIHLVEESLTKSLIGIYHGRITYPEQRTA